MLECMDHSFLPQTSSNENKSSVAPGHCVKVGLVGLVHTVEETVFVCSFLVTPVLETGYGV